MSANENNERAKIELPWNKGAWVVTLCLTGLSLVSLFLADKRLDASAILIDLRYGMYGPALYALIVIASITMLTFVLPILLPVIARHQPFLWGGLPLLGLFGFLCWSGFVIKQYAVSQFLSIVMLWMITSGIGLLIRFLVRRRRAVLTAIPVSDVHSEKWPPAPREEGEESVTLPPG
jgi:hypothetical protein